MGGYHCVSDKFVVYLYSIHWVTDILKAFRLGIIQYDRVSDKFVVDFFYSIEHDALASCDLLLLFLWMSWPQVVDSDRSPQGMAWSSGCG